MKSAEEWHRWQIEQQATDKETVEAIREEMRQECFKAWDATPNATTYDEMRAAILNAGKPKLRKGQLVLWSQKGTGIGVVYIPEDWEDPSVPLKWSDLCDEDGEGLPMPIYSTHRDNPQVIHDGPVFLKEARDE